MLPRLLSLLMVKGMLTEVNDLWNPFTSAIRGLSLFSSFFISLIYKVYTAMRDTVPCSIVTETFYLHEKVSFHK